MPGANELIRLASPQVERARGGGASRRFGVRFGRSLAAPRVRQGVSQLLVEGAPLRARRLPELDGNRVERRGLVEGERVGRHVGGSCRVLRGAFGVTGLTPMQRQRFHVPATRRLEGASERAVTLRARRSMRYANTAARTR